MENTRYYPSSGWTIFSQRNFSGFSVTMGTNLVQIVGAVLLLLPFVLRGLTLYKQARLLAIVITIYRDNREDKSELTAKYNLLHKVFEELLVSQFALSETKGLLESQSRS